MADEELSAPLGQTDRKPRRRLPPGLVAKATAALLTGCVLVFAGWAAVVSDPLGGEPMAIVATAAPPAPDTAKPQPATKDAPRAYEGPAVQAPVARATQVVTIIDGSTGQRQEIPIAGSPDVRAPVDQKLLETTRHGSIPRVGPDGARPSEVYAQPVRRGRNKADGPRVAIVIAGLGISTSASEAVFSRLPGAVTFAVTPYAPDAEAIATRARAAGHEVLLQVPMEPFDYPDNDPGPQTLLTALAAQQNVDRLHWAMSRIQGYVGLTNYMGARFVASEPSLTPVLREVAKRGLVYVDDGAAVRSVAGQIAGANNLPFGRADVTLDAVPSQAGIDRALARLETLARERGSAIGFSAPLPAAIDRIAQWIKAAESRGITVVPISAVALRARSS